MILLGSDGIFDKLQNEEIFKIVREEARAHTEIMPSKIQLYSFDHLATVCGAGVNAVMRAAMQQESTDNLTVVILAFKNFVAFLKTLQVYRKEVAHHRSPTEVPIIKVQEKTDYLYLKTDPTLQDQKYNL